MSKERHAESLCRLCLTKTKDKVPIFGKEESNVINLLMLIELDIDPDQERDAIVCFDCIVTLEGFFQFKEQCHENDEYLKTLPSKASVDSTAIDEPRMQCDFLDSEEEGLVEDYYGLEESTLKREAPGGRSKKKGAKRLRSAVLDPDEVERDCVKFKIRKCPSDGPTLADLQILRDSYPDYFYFEKGSRSLYFTLVYYGERFNSATYSERYTYYKCIYRRKHNCKALVVARNDYSQFERRYEHSHGELEERSGLEEYSPRQALPEVFRICRQILAQKTAQRRNASVERKKMKLELSRGEESWELGEEEDGLRNEGSGDVLSKVLHKSGILEGEDDDGEDED
ncbi:conserved hypothetical protein [Culex quinquefasciatus]|uniref:ZAD domain-containing protein n=1 Tax=Culex quinquefasciatus TaxID=7176 RepID=B0W7D3_CULQU|nr:conserved hypothetical protein [Culex quinquefasciatus]|eukprot:XP_001844617.1 conserved hypothetical protein [Culex quinquefasciatus]